jgi:putative Mg2+ transporter-C (MgtC) family protein
VLEWPEIFLRLGAATLAGGLLGLNRDLQGKPIGLKTLGLVGLATAMIVMATDPSANVGKVSDPASRAIQGILTGIGFLGAGVIVHTQHMKVHGLTSAACTWFAACVGIACGVGHWRIVLAAIAIAFIVLIIGRPIEQSLHRWLGGDDNPERESRPADKPPS